MLPNHFLQPSALHTRLLLIALACCMLILVTTSIARGGDLFSAESDTIVQPVIDIELPSVPCPGTDHPDCVDASPNVADLNADGAKEIVVATYSGYVIALDAAGNEQWRTDLAPFFGMAPGEQRLRSSTAVGDLDGNGLLDIVIATGGLDQDDICRPGGVIVLDHTGALVDGWPKLSEPNSDGCARGYFATPALGDLDQDGDLEIVIGGFDKRLHVWHHDGVAQPNFPLDSYHSHRFPTWPNLRGQLADSIWSSPSLADIDGDGYLDIVFGSDEGNFDDRYGGDSGGWECPYTLPDGWPEGYCGGSVYAVDRFGNHLPGFPKYVPEIVQSSPVVADINGDGWPEIITGTGTFYYNASPDNPTDGFRVYVWDHTGQPLSGWENGIATTGATPTSPAVGNITGDTRPEVIMLDAAGQLYAWHADGSAVAGFPMTPLTTVGTSHSFGLGKSPLVADFDGGGYQEIFVAMNGSVTVVDGQGVQRTSTDIWNTPLPAYMMSGSVQNTPAIADLDEDGYPDLLVHNSTLRVWPLSDAVKRSDWPMAGYNPQRTASTALRNPPLITLDQQQLLLLYDVERTDDPTKSLTLTIRNASSTAWHVTANSPRVSVTPNSGATEESSVALTVTVAVAGLTQGVYDLGRITIEVESVAAEDGSTRFAVIEVPISVKLAQFDYSYHPLIVR